MVKSSAIKGAVSASEFNILMAVLTGLLVFIMAARTPLDTDFWWHIRAGELTWQSGRPLVTDLFTFTRGGHPWINHSWLGEVIYYLFFKAGGFLGVSLLVASLATASMMLVYAQLTGPALLKTAVIVLASTVAGPVWSPRPQLISQVLFAGLYLILNRYRSGRFDRLWLLPVLFLAWSNLHAGYSLGFLLLGVFIVGEMLNWILRPGTDRRIAWRNLRKLILWALVCVPVVLINPNGLETWTIPFQTVGMDAAVRSTIDEWASPDFHQLILQPFLWMLFAFLAAVGLSARKIDAVDLLGVAGFSYLAFLAKRSLAIFALFTAPALARYLWAAVCVWREERAGPASSPSAGKTVFSSRLVRPGLRKALNLTLVFLLSLTAVGKLLFVTQAGLIEKARAEYFPDGAVQFLLNGQPPGNIFNSYGWGGYLEWHLRDFPVFIDGRADLFGDEFIRAWLNTVQAGEGWQETFSAWDIRYCLIEPDWPLADALREARAAVLYEDQTSVLFDISGGIHFPLGSTSQSSP